MVPMSSVSPEGMRGCSGLLGERVVAGGAGGEEAVVADLDDLAHLPEGLDREMAAALEVVPLLPAWEGRDELGVVDRDDRGTQHEARRIGLADLEQRRPAEPVGPGHALGAAASEVEQVDLTGLGRLDLGP